MVDSIQECPTCKGIIIKGGSSGDRMRTSIGKILTKEEANKKICCYAKGKPCSLGCPSRVRPVSNEEIYNQLVPPGQRTDWVAVARELIERHNGRTDKKNSPRI